MGIGNGLRFLIKLNRMDRNKGFQSDSSQHLIRAAIRKIALGRSMGRIDMAPVGSGGIGTARMIHGYVAKIHDDPADEEFEEYGGTIDVGEFPDETASAEPVLYKGVLLAGLKDNSGGFLIVPTLFSDVTIVSDAASRYMYVLNYSHADILQLQAHRESRIGVTETEELDVSDNDSPDYDELAPTGNETKTVYTATRIYTSAADKGGKFSEIEVCPEGIRHSVDRSVARLAAGKQEYLVSKTGVVIADGKICIGDESAVEAVVLGNQLAGLMLEFLTECSKIMTPTLMGTMPAVNVASFASLTAKIEGFLSKTVYTK